MEKTVNTIEYGIFELVSNFENIKNNKDNIKALVEFYNNKIDDIGSLCTFSGDLYSKAEALNKIFTQGLDSNNNRCSPPDSTTTTTTTPSSDVVANDCNMDFVGYGYCSNNPNEKCLGNSVSCNCNNYSSQFEYQSGYDIAFATYKSQVISNIQSRQEYISLKDSFNKMNAYDKYIENSGNIVTGYFSHCVLFIMMIYFL